MSITALEHKTIRLLQAVRATIPEVELPPLERVDLTVFSPDEKARFLAFKREIRPRLQMWDDYDKLTDQERDFLHLWLYLEHARVTNNQEQAQRVRYWLDYTLQEVYERFLLLQEHDIPSDNPPQVEREGVHYSLSRANFQYDRGDLQRSMQRGQNLYEIDRARMWIEHYDPTYPSAQT